MQTDYSRGRFPWVMFITHQLNRFLAYRCCSQMNSFVFYMLVLSWNGWLSSVPLNHHSIFNAKRWPSPMQTVWMKTDRGCCGSVLVVTQLRAANNGDDWEISGQNTALIGVITTWVTSKSTTQCGKHQPRNQTTHSSWSSWSNLNLNCTPLSVRLSHWCDKINGQCWT